MTTPNQAHEAIYARFKAQFAAQAVAYHFEGEAFNPPEKLPWCRLSVRTRLRRQETLGPLGARKVKTAASVMVQVFVLTNTGRQLADALTRAVVSIFELTSFSGLDFFNGVAREQPVDGKWLPFLCEIEFSYDETK